MGLASVCVYIKSVLDGMEWPPGITNLNNPPPPLQAFITPPNPFVQASQPAAYVWFARGLENRNNTRHGAGTVPRAAYPGAFSGTKAIDHMVPVYLVWNGGSPTDPVADTLFPGMVDAIMARLRTSQDPAELTDPWNGVQSWAVDVGETLNYTTALRALEEQQLERLDALIEVSVEEVIAG